MPDSVLDKEREDYGYKLKLAQCKDPKTPLRVALSLLKHIRIFDLAELTRNHYISTVLRQKIELMIAEKLPSLPSGVKSALARKANSNIVLALMEKGDRHVIDACLESPMLTEGHIIKVINKPSARPLLVKKIASHTKWSLRYDVRFSLIRNFYTPMEQVSAFIRSMKTRDLKFLYSDSKVPSSTKPFIYRELFGRNETTEEEDAEVYEIDAGEL